MFMYQYPLLFICVMSTINNPQNHNNELGSQIQAFLDMLDKLDNKLDLTNNKIDDTNGRVIHIEANVNALIESDKEKRRELEKLNEDSIVYKTTLFGHNNNNGLSGDVELIKKDVSTQNNTINKWKGIAMAISFVVPFVVSIITSYIKGS